MVWSFNSRVPLLHPANRCLRAPAPPAKPQMENMSRYFGMVKCIDDNVGKILAAIRDTGVAEPHNRRVHRRSRRHVR